MYLMRLQFFTSILKFKKPTLLQQPQLKLPRLSSRTVKEWSLPSFHCPQELRNEQSIKNALSEPQPCKELTRLDCHSRIQPDLCLGA